MRRRQVGVPVTLVLVLALAAFVTGSYATSAPGAVASRPTAATKYDWLQFGLTPDKDADDMAETTITASNVSHLQPLFHTSLSDAPDGAPVLLTGVSTPSGTRDLVFLQGEHGHLMAFDANSGASVWTDSFAGTGIANSAPAIDPNRQFIYMDSNDGFVHKVNVGDGSEVRGGGWPELAGPGKSSSQLTIATAKNGHTYLYASNQGHGHLTTIDLGTGAQHVFSFACADRPDIHFGAAGQPNDCAVSGANPWARGPSFDPSLDRIFQMAGTNNGSTFVPGHVYRQSWVALPPDGSTTVTSAGGFPADSYTPADWAATVKSDRDIGSGGLLILPVGLSSKFPHLGVQPGKDRRIRLLNLADLSGQGGPGHTGGELQLFNFPQMSMMRSQGAVWTNPADHSVWAFVPGENGIAGFQVTVDGAGNPSLNLRWTVFNGWTTSALVANGVLFAATGGGEHTPTQANHIIQAFDPTTGHTLWTAPIGLHHWSSPIVANGTVYMPDGNSGGFGSGTTGDLLAWRLSGGPTPTPSGTPVGTPTPSTSPGATSYEAESSANTLGGRARVATCGACSGGGKVGFVGRGGTLTFNRVMAASAGSYTLTIRYCDGDAGRNADLSVNGGAATSLHFTNTGGFGTPGTRTVTVQLNAGANTIEFSNPSASAPDFDRILL
jgi:hypothetical protein